MQIDVLVKLILFHICLQNAKYHLHPNSHQTEAQSTPAQHFLDFQGNVHACCYLGGSFLKKRFNENDDAILEWYDENDNNALQNDLSDILLFSDFFQHLQNSWTVLPSKSCKRFCSKNNLRKKLND